MAYGQPLFFQPRRSHILPANPFEDITFERDPSQPAPERDVQVVTRLRSKLRRHWQAHRDYLNRFTLFGAGAMLIAGLLLAYAVTRGLDAPQFQRGETAPVPTYQDAPASMILRDVPAPVANLSSTLQYPDSKLTPLDATIPPVMRPAVAAVPPNIPDWAIPQWRQRVAETVYGEGAIVNNPVLWRFLAEQIIRDSQNCALTDPPKFDCTRHDGTCDQLYVFETIWNGRADINAIQGTAIERIVDQAFADYLVKYEWPDCDYIDNFDGIARHGLNWQYQFSDATGLRSHSEYAWGCRLGGS